MSQVFQDARAHLVLQDWKAYLVSMVKQVRVFSLVLGDRLLTVTLSKLSLFPINLIDSFCQQWPNVSVGLICRIFPFV